MTDQTLEIAQLTQAGTVTSGAWLVVQDGVAGTPLRKATAAQVMDGLIDAIGTGTIVADDVIITGGTATLDVGSVVSLDIGTVDISGGTGTLSAATIGTLTNTTITSTIGAFTTLNTGTLDATGGTATLSAGTIASVSASTLAVSGTATANVLTGTVANVGTITGTIVSVPGTATVNVLTGTTAAITTLTGTTATLTTAVVTTGTIGAAVHAKAPLMPTWSLAFEDAAGNVAGGIDTEGTLRFSDASHDTATIATGTITGTLTVASADVTSLDATTAIVTTGTIGGLVHNSSKLTPGWAMYVPDSAGRIAGGVKSDGTLRFSRAHFDTLVSQAASEDASARLVSAALSREVDSAGYIARAMTPSGRVLFTPRSAVIARAARQIARPTNLHSYTPPRTGEDDTVTSGTTIATLWTCDMEFDYVRIVLGQQSANSVTARAIIAPTAEANDGVNPLDDDGNPVSWTTVLFNNSGSANYSPWNQNTGSTDSITQVTSSETQVWGLTYSDWMQVSALPQTGGSAFPLLMIRVYLTGTPVAIDMTSTNLFGLTPTTSNFGRTWAGYKATGDYVTTPASYPSSGTSWGDRWAPLFIQTYSRKLGYQVWGCGDSNMAGTGSANGFMGFYRRSCLRVGVSAPVVASNFNQPGSSPTIYMSNVENIIDTVKPSALVMFPFSYNTPATMANLNTNWARALDMCQRVNAYGGVPILVGYPPRDSATADDDAVRRIGLERLEYARASGMRVVNPEDKIGDAASPAAWLSGMSDDGVHFSNQGHAVMADYLAYELAEAFGVV